MKQKYDDLAEDVIVLSDLRLANLGIHQLFTLAFGDMEAHLDLNHSRNPKRALTGAGAALRRSLLRTWESGRPNTGSVAPKYQLALNCFKVVFIRECC